MVKKWEIYFISLNPTKGSEQAGMRPVLVISNDAVNSHLPIFTCIPFSSVKPGAKIYPTEVLLTTEETGLNKLSVLMIQQIRTVSAERVTGAAIARIDDPAARAKILEAIREYFAF